MAGPLAGSDDDVGIEELDVADELGNRPVLHDGVGTMLDVSVGEDPHRPGRAARLR